MLGATCRIGTGLWVTDPAALSAVEDRRIVVPTVHQRVRIECNRE